MKLLFCEDCADIIAPLPVARMPRFCNCERHAVWWEEPESGVISVCDFTAKMAHRQLLEPQEPFTGTPLNGVPRCWLLGIVNPFLQSSIPGNMAAADIARMLDELPDNFMFKQQNSPIVRFRPGGSADSSWSDVPELVPVGTQIQ